MKTNRTLIAMCIATLFASTSLQAKDKWEYHTDGWEKTKSYANVMVSNDTVQKWGPWEEFVEPAAGAPSIAFLGAGAGDPYNVLPKPIPPTPEVGCPAGEWCGYIAVQLKERYGGYGDGYGRSYYGGGGWHNVGDAVGGEIALQFQPSDGPLPWGGPWNEGAVNLRLLTSLPDFGIGAGAETGMIPVEFNGYQGWFDSLKYEGDISLEGGYDGKYYDSTATSWWQIWKKVNEYATMGTLITYVYGDDESEYKVYAPFVAGLPTPTSDMPGNVTAFYRGETGLARGDVCMRVNFGAGNWSGTFNGGYGTYGFSVEGGALNGSGFSASSGNLSAWGSSVSGTVKGTFYGPQAAAAGGLIDVTKTSNYESYARSEGPTSTRYVDVFLANKVAQVPNVSVVPK